MTHANSTVVIDEKVIAGLRQLFPEQAQAQVFLNDLIKTFFDSGRQTVAALEETLGAANLPAVAKNAHRLKGIGRNIGAQRLGFACAKLETEAAHASMDEIKALCHTVVHEFQLSCSELTKVYARP